MAISDYSVVWSAAVMVCLALCSTNHYVTACPVGTTAAPGGSHSDECNTGMPPPDHPFKVIWNNPDNCEKKKKKRKPYPLPLEEFGFTFNKKRVFLGEEILTLYRTGVWPKLNKTGFPIHGGLPQLFNDTDFNKTWEDLGKYRVENFTGLGVLDFETWRAIYKTNFKSNKYLNMYQNQSEELVKQRHPEYNKTMLKTMAEIEFEEAARRIFLAKLSIGQTLMPGGYWGYYDYPRAWKKAKIVRNNDRIIWLWRQATGLFPSTYQSGHDAEKKLKLLDKVERGVAEAVRIQNAFSPPNTVIYPYVNIQHNLVENTDFFDEDHFRISMELPADMGASGVIIWGASRHYRSFDKQCGGLQKYLKETLGPFVKNLTDTMLKCSNTLCGGHGRCVHNTRDVLLNLTNCETLSRACANRTSPFRDYHCRCYSPWGGACCDISLPVPCKQPSVKGT